LFHPNYQYYQDYW